MVVNQRHDDDKRPTIQRNHEERGQRGLAACEINMIKGLEDWCRSGKNWVIGCHDMTHIIFPTTQGHAVLDPFPNIILMNAKGERFKVIKSASSENGNGMPFLKLQKLGDGQESGCEA